MSRHTSVTLAVVDSEPSHGVSGDVPAPRPSSDPAVLTPLVPTGPPIVRVRRSRWRHAFAVAIAVVPLLCVVGIPFAFHSYDVATRPDRSAPDVVVHNYLQAFLVDRDDAVAGNFACADKSGLAPLAAFRAQ